VGALAVRVWVPVITLGRLRRDAGISARKDLRAVNRNTRTGTPAVSRIQADRVDYEKEFVGAGGLGVPTAVTEGPQLLFNDPPLTLGYFQPFGGIGLAGIKVAFAWRWAGPCAGASRYFLMVRQLIRRRRSIFRIGKCSYRYRRCRSLIR
jgi:hypothetical protein